MITCRYLDILASGYVDGVFRWRQTAVHVALVVQLSVVHSDAIRLVAEAVLVLTLADALALPSDVERPRRRGRRAYVNPVVAFYRRELTPLTLVESDCELCFQQ